jgi:fructose-1-phosphate kinase PfkB-like protein
VVKLKTNNYQNLPWNNTIEEDTIRYSDLFAGGKGINVWPIVKDSTPTPCSVAFD